MFSYYAQKFYTFSKKLSHWGCLLKNFLWVKTFCKRCSNIGMRKLNAYWWEAAIFRRNLRFEKCYFYFLRPREWARHILLSNAEKMWIVPVKRWKRSCRHCWSGPQSCCRSTIGCFYVKCSTLGKNLKWWRDAMVYALWILIWHHLPTRKKIKTHPLMLFLQSTARVFTKIALWSSWRSVPSWWESLVSLCTHKTLTLLHERRSENCRSCRVCSAVKTHFYRRPAAQLV